MAEYIERTHAIASAISGRIRALPTTEDGEDWIRVEEVRESLKSIPAADVVPVRHGRWVKRMEEKETPKYQSFTPIWSCSECKREYDPAACAKINYCPNCGAKMMEAADNGV